MLIIEFVHHYCSSTTHTVEYRELLKSAARFQNEEPASVKLRHSETPVFDSQLIVV